MINAGTTVRPAPRTTKQPEAHNKSANDSSVGSLATARPVPAGDGAVRQQGSQSNGQGGSKEGSAQPGLSALANDGNQLALAALKSSLTEAQLAEVIAAASSGTAAPDAAQGKDAAALASITKQFQQRFTGQAGNKEEFHNLLKKSFGGTYDAGKAESIRKQTLAGDFSWMPKVKVVDGASLTDVSGKQGGAQGMGAYSKDNDTVYLSRELLHSNPVKAEKILTEEVGHALDTRLNTTDTKGDEGDVFSRLSHGENISEGELKALKAENDSGTIVVDGKEVEVEYGLFSGIKKAVKKVGRGIKGAVKKVGKGLKKLGGKIKNGIKKVGKALKKAVKKFLTSSFVGAVLTVLRFIPVTAVFANIAIMARSAYMVYQGIKHKSMGAVLGGIAGVAGGLSAAGGALGMSAGAVSKAATVANYASKASKIYSAVANKDFSAAASLVSGHFGANSTVGQIATRVGQADQIYNSAKNGDVFGAISSGATVLQDFTGPEGDKTLQSISKNAGDIGKIQRAYESGDYSTALNLANASFGNTLNLSPAARQKVEQFTGTLRSMETARNLYENGDYAEAGMSLLTTASSMTNNDVTKRKLENAGKAMLQVDSAVKAFEEDRFEDAIGRAETALKQPLDPKTKAKLTNILIRANQVRDLAKLAG